MRLWVQRHIHLVIYCVSLGLALAIFLWFRQTVPLFSTLKVRLIEAYAFSALSYLYAALLISPLYAVLPGLPGKSLAGVARRAIGISCFFFALLHGSLAFFGLLQGFPGLAYLSSRYLIAVLIGFTALSFLALMAIASFDRLVRLLGKLWKVTHWIIYLAGLAVMFHFLSLGSHFMNMQRFIPRLIIGLIGVLFALQALRIYKLIKPHYPIFAPYGLAMLFVIIIYIVYSVLTENNLHVH